MQKQVPVLYESKFMTPLRIYGRNKNSQNPCVVNSFLTLKVNFKMERTPFWKGLHNVQMRNHLFKAHFIPGTARRNAETKHA